MKKILMICESFGGGVFTYVSQLCNDMVENFEIYLMYSVRKQTPQNFKEYIDERVNLIEIKDFGKKNKIFKNIKLIKDKVNEINPDVIHLHSSIAGGIGRIALKNRKNVVYTPHGYAHILMGKGFKSLCYKTIEKILGNRAITLTCCESEDKEAKKFSNKTFFIETGVNLTELKKDLENLDVEKKERFTVFSLGRICVQKQPEIFNEIASRVPEADFLWIGDGELKNLLTSENIVVTGWKPRKEALKIAKGADAFILCSLGEAIAMSLIENMFIKKLCLVSNVMGNKSVIKNNYNGYVCDTVEEYVKAIKDSINEFPQKMVENAYQDVENIYNTCAMKRKYIEFYNMDFNTF